MYKLWDDGGELAYGELTYDVGKLNSTMYNTSKEWNLDNGMFKFKSQNPITAVDVPPCTEHPQLCSDGQCERTDSVNHKASLDAGCLTHDKNTVYLLNREKRSTVTLASANTAWIRSCLENASEIRDPRVLRTQFCTNPTCTDATGEPVDAVSHAACDAAGGTWGDDKCRTLVGECTGLLGEVVNDVGDKVACEGNNATWENATCTGAVGNAVSGATSKSDCVQDNRTWKPSAWAQFYCSNAAPCGEEDVPGGVILTKAQQIRLHASKNNPAAIEALCESDANLCSKFTEGAVSATMCAEDPLGCAKTITDPVGRCEYLPKSQGCPFVPPLPSEKDVVRLHFEDHTRGFEKKRKITIFSVGGAVAVMVIGVVALVVYDRFFSAE